jgi:hypothetical protein
MEQPVPIEIAVALRGGLFEDVHFRGAVGYNIGERLVEMKRDYWPLSAGASSSRSSKPLWARRYWRKSKPNISHDSESSTRFDQFRSTECANDVPYKSDLLSS